MASLTRWTWVCVNSGIWWWTERPGVLRFMGSQRVRHNWVTELNWTELNHHLNYEYRQSVSVLQLQPWKPVCLSKQKLIQPHWLYFWKMGETEFLDNWIFRSLIETDRNARSYSLVLFQMQSMLRWLFVSSSGLILQLLWLVLKENSFDSSRIYEYWLCATYLPKHWRLYSKT